jgi:hypothetical protein
MPPHQETGPPKRERPALAGTGALEKTGKDEVRRYREARTESPVLSRLADLAARIKIEHSAAGAAVRKGAKHAMAAGDLLIEAKAQLGRHGQWLPWLRDHCELSARVAQQYMRVAKNRAEIEVKYESDSHLTLRAALASLVPDDPDDEADDAAPPPCFAGNGNNEWYTPKEWIDSARAVMSTIDLDPASCEFAQRTVQATEWFDQERDGLARPWRGSIWLNPPYSGGLIKQFIDKLVIERKNFAQAVVLVHSRTDTEWFHDLCSIADVIAFTKKRISFYNKYGEQESPLYGSVLVYIGDRQEEFAEAFRDSCFVLPCGDRRLPLLTSPAAS